MLKDIVEVRVLDGYRLYLRFEDNWAPFAGRMALISIPMCCTRESPANRFRISKINLSADRESLTLQIMK